MSGVQLKTAQLAEMLNLFNKDKSLPADSITPTVIYICREMSK